MKESERAPGERYDVEAIGVEVLFGFFLVLKSFQRFCSDSEVVNKDSPHCSLTSLACRLVAPISAPKSKIEFIMFLSFLQRRTSFNTLPRRHPVVTKRARRGAVRHRSLWLCNILKRVRESAC